MCFNGTCNPLCSGCMPKRIVQVVCSGCGKKNSIKRDEYLMHFKLPHGKSQAEKEMISQGHIVNMTCKSCGCDLEDDYRASMQPTECKRTGIVCGFPCDRSLEEPNAQNRTCQYAVPLRKVSA